MLLARALARGPPRRGLHVAAIQLSISHTMADNIERAAYLVDQAAAQGAKFVALPECFTGKYGVEHFAKWAEPVLAEAGASSGLSGATMMRERAQHHGIVVTGGVIEVHEGKLWNTMPVFGPEGQMLALYRKVHLSRVLGVTSESDVLTAGSEPTSFDLPGLAALRVGMICCFDLRFRDLLAQYGPAAGDHAPCGVLCAPSAFLRATGTEHWDLLVRRAGLDGQSYVVAPDVAYCEDDPVPLHGHSMVADPWGRILAQCEGEGDGIALASVDPLYVEEVRGKLPLAALAAKFESTVVSLAG